MFVIYGLSLNIQSTLSSTVTPACTNRNVRVYLLLIIVDYVSLAYAPLWIQSEAKGMNKAGYKT